MTVVSDRIGKVFKSLRITVAAQAVALNIFKASDRVWHAFLLHKLKSYGIPGRIFRLIPCFLSNRQL